MKDYSHLKGSEVVCVTKNSWDTTDTKQAKGFVADIDYKKGITIKSTKTQGDIMCLNKKEFNKGFYAWIGLSWKDLFNNIVSQIEQGKYSFAKISKSSDNTSDSSPCAFE